MRRRGRRGPPWPGELLSFDELRWREAGDRFTEDALARWTAARQAFAGTHSLDDVQTMIGGQCWRRAAFLDGIVWDPRELQPGLDQRA